MSKLKRFMTAVQFIMQDSLRFLLLNSINEYAKMLSHATSLNVLIQGTNDIKVTERDALVNDHHMIGLTQPDAASRKPLFLMDLICRDGTFQYSNDFAQFDQVVLSTFEKSFGIIEGLPNLEPIVMDKLFWATKPTLESVHESDPSVAVVRNKVKEALEETAIPLKQYIREYDKHLDLLNLDVNQFMKEYEEKDLPVPQIEKDILLQFEQREALSRDLPSVVHLGSYAINCESIRNVLRKDLSRALLDILAKKTSREAVQVSLVFHQMQQRLKERPTKIEESKELREYIKTIPEVCRAQSDKIEAMLRDYDVLEKFKYELSNEDFKSRWNTFAWPGRIDDIVKQVEEQLDIDEANFMRNLASDQEVFRERINQFSNMIHDFAKYDDVERVTDIVGEVHKISQELKECQGLVQLFNSRERLFNLPVTPYEEVAAIIKEFEPYKSLWLTTNDWIKWKEAWCSGPFNNLVPDEVEKSLTGAIRVMNKSVKVFKNTPTCLDVALKMKEEMEQFKPNLPLIQALRNPGMRDRHWDTLSKELGIPLRPDESVTLTSLLKMDLLSKIDMISKVCDVAGKEYSIEAALDKMSKEWETIELDLISYKETGTFILKLSEDVVRLLDDHIVMTQSMSFSPYKKAFADRIALWDVKLRTVQEVLEAWTTCQRNWLYLEPIFSSDDIARQLPTESKRFGTMDRTWRRLVGQAKSKPHLLDYCSDMRLLDSFRECNKLLEVVSKGLSAYLESKRLAFPRFFFLSDDELLQILSQTKDPQAVQPHLRKCFENIAKLEFEKDNLITAMHAADGECVWMCEGFYPKGNVEDWLNKTEQMMKASIKNVMHLGLQDYPERPRREWVLCWPGQVILAVSQVIFTRDVSEAIKKGLDGLKQYYLFLLQQLNDLVELVRGDLAPIARMVLADLIIVDVHNRDIVMRLIDASITSVNDFDWISQLRYYWESDNLVIKIVNAAFNYGYEYLGNTGRLVITPLTDRCYLTLTGAMYLGMGGAPSGPAGTGKTETVKDLAKALAKQCVVFNCSDQLDYLAMAKFFKGLASAGAWACFDEFNRIDIEVLSVIAQQISTIQKAASAGLTRFMFEGIELKLDPTNAIFITMNPGYAGRTELPDNLKALFRPVAMMIPDYAMIAEISLFSFGFSNAKLLAQKMVATFRLSSEQLSSQDHYDFGMRAVKTVISSAGNLKREQPQTAEELLLLKALCDVNLPKFLANDVPLFTGIISDLFPGVSQPKIDYGNLLESIKKNCDKIGLQPVESFLGKCIQMYETTVVRHGMMLVGPTGGGKTSCYQVLRGALTDLKGKTSPSGSLFERVQCYMLNPKSITMGQLYGEFDPQTHEWTDGILSCLVREGTDDPSSDKKWYVFDGPVDAIWIESMNTVLDDNKKLCLSSGEIIKLSRTQTLIFEVENLAHASPATVSRCGMVYMEPGALGLGCLVKSWLGKHSDILIGAYPSKLSSLCDTFLDAGLEFVRRHVKESIPSTNVNLASSLLKILHCLLVKFQALRASPQDGEEGVELGNVLEAFFLFSLVWSLGATCDADGRRRFDTWLRGKLSNWQQQIPIPSHGLVFDYRFDDGNLEWVPWMSADDDDDSIFSSQQGADIIIPTIDTIRTTFLLDLLLHNHCHVLCYGPTGTGKSATIQQKLLHGMQPEYSGILLNFSARTSANQTADVLESKLEKRRKGVFGPAIGKKFVVFVDDLNMPAMEPTGAQPPIELLRQWMDYKGWYDRKNIGSFMEIVDIVFLCAMGPPGGGRNPITPRLLRHFVYVPFVEVEEDNLFRIFHTILKHFLNQNAKDLVPHAESIVRGSINVYNVIRRELLPTPAKSHYTFNLRDLSKVFQGVLLSHIKSIEHQNDLFQLWAHECLRVFSDRLVDTSDKNWFLVLMKTTMQTFFHKDWAEVVTTDPLLFGDYMTPGADPKQYIQVKDMRKLVKIAEEYLEDYNSATNSPMRLVMFLDAIEHVSRICRIIRQPKGNALLLGVGGSGRQSLSRLACYMEEYDCIQIEITKSYGQTEWREDLKKVLLAAGLEGKPMSFLFSDTQIIAESCVEDINNILNSGDVPNLYVTDEMERINNAMRSIIVDAGGTPTKESIYSLYISRVRQNLHIILCMSPIGEAFRNRLRMFPSLVNCCTIDWFSTWPEEALRSVAAHSVAGLRMLITL
jgi:dynein heavy chain